MDGDARFQATKLEDLATFARAPSDGVTVQDLEGRLVYANDSAARFYGFSDARTLLATSPAEIAACSTLVDETGAPFDLARLPGLQAIRGETPAPLVLGGRQHGTGAIVWSVLQSDTIRDRSGKPVLAFTIFHDLARARRDKQRERILARVTADLASSLDYETTLASVADALVPDLADWCLVELVEGDSTRIVAVLHRDPAKVALARQIREDYPPRNDPHAPSSRALANGESILTADVDDATLAAHASDPAHLAALRALGLRSAISVPIVVGRKVEGALTLVSADSRRRFDGEDLELAEELGRRFGTAIEHARAYRSAQEAIRARDDFLAVVGHELRTPLATLVLQLETLKRAVASGTSMPAIAAERIDKTLEQTNRLNRLLDALLDVTRVTAGRLVLEPEPMDLAQLVREVAERFVEEAARAGSPLLVRAPASFPGVWDERRLDQVISNLLSNALKYAAGNPIELSCTAMSDRALIRVKDGGVGVTPDDAKRIFERFARGSAARDIGGLGLGLWITREIVSAHGGSIDVESQPGEGATFTIEIPARRTAT